ncbi:MAG: TerC family protein [Anaerolineaceae bacterium]|nr:TerC family protein [Anaerolineaceae bacterium]
MDLIFESAIALITLILLEVVLGIDNIIFLTILSGKLPKENRYQAQRLGLGLAVVTRIGLLFSISLLAKLTDPLFSVFSHEVTGREIVMLAGGLFLLAKSTIEIQENLEYHDHKEEVRDKEKKRTSTFWGVIVQIALLDIVFSLDSVITAVGISNQLWVMITAIVIAIGVMILFAPKISDFIENHPSLKILALAFLMLIGFSLVAEGFGQEIPKGYIYFSMFFAIFIEMINMRYRKVRDRKKAVQE